MYKCKSTCIIYILIDKEKLLHESSMQNHTILDSYFTMKANTCMLKQVHHTLLLLEECTVCTHSMVALVKGKQY